MVDLASYGFMVGAVFHGDPRFSRIRIEDLRGLASALAEFDEFVEMELLRPVSGGAQREAMLRAERCVRREIGRGRRLTEIR